MAKPRKEGSASHHQKCRKTDEHEPDGCCPRVDERYDGIPGEKTSPVVS